MKRFIQSVLISLVLLPVHAGALTLQQTTMVTTNATAGGSVFNPFPLLGASAPLATSSTTFNPSPVIGSAPVTPATGISAFNPFPLAGAAAPLASPAQPFTPTTSGSAAPRFPDAAGGTLTPAAQDGSTLIPSTLPSVATITTTTLAAQTLIPTATTLPSAATTTTTSTINTTSTTAGISPLVQTTTTTIVPLSLSLGFAQSLSSAADPISTARLVQNPEPSTLFLFASGCAVLAWYGLRRRRNLCS